jgi:hypothetical protein
MARHLVIGLLAGLAASAALASGAAAAPCESLAGFKLPGGHIDSAAAVAQSGPIALGGAMPSLPSPAAFCRVQATLTPTPSSDIKIEVWLPPQGGWNGKLLGAGNGGYGGGFGSPILTMLPAIKRGYAAAGTNMGHVSGADIDASWALHQPEKIKDFAWRANHLTATAAKALIAAYYGAAPAHAYFQGCSDGGHEALMEAQKFPADYDGIIAGAPASAWTHLMTAFAWDERSSHIGGVPIIPNAKLSLIQSAAQAQCAALDPLKDGYFNDPRACKFDPARLRCKVGDAADCLTDAQIAALRKIYSGPVSPRTGASLYPGYAAGSEAQPSTWEMWITGPKAQHGSFARAFYKDMVFSDANWDMASFDVDRDGARGDRELGGLINADDPDMTAFVRRGGKLILYHGWNDGAIPAQGTVDYYGRIQSRMGAAADQSVRLFMVPGMGHCLMGPGPNTFDILGALEQWREHGQAPERIVASKYGNDLLAYIGFAVGKPLKTRPLCAYPRVATWKGAGSTNDAANFSCEAPRSGRVG